MPKVFQRARVSVQRSARDPHGSTAAPAALAEAFAPSKTPIHKDERVSYNADARKTHLHRVSMDKKRGWMFVVKTSHDPGARSCSAAEQSPASSNIRRTVRIYWRLEPCMER